MWESNEPQYRLSLHDIFESFYVVICLLVHFQHINLMVCLKDIHSYLAGYISSQIVNYVAIYLLYAFEFLTSSSLASVCISTHVCIRCTCAHVATVCRLIHCNCQQLCTYLQLQVFIYYTLSSCVRISLSTLVLNSRDRHGNLWLPPKN